MNQTTEENMINAIAGECQARVKYQFFAEKAKQEGFTNVARLFTSVSDAEQVHATHHYRLLSHLNGGFTTIAKGTFGPGNTSKNLGLCIMGETYEITEMYPSFKAIAELQNEKAAFTSFDWAYQTEKVHRELFKKAKDAVDGGKDLDLGPVQICQVCGFTIEGDAPDRCPICKASKEKFKTFNT
jgi:rubrerythrin